MNRRLKKLMALFIALSMLLNIGVYADGFGQVESNPLEDVENPATTVGNLVDEDNSNIEEKEEVKASLKLIHNYYFNDKEIVEEEIVENLLMDTEINIPDYALKDKNLIFSGSNPETLIITGTEKDIANLYYEEIRNEKSQPFDKVNDFNQSIQTFSNRIALMNSEPDPNEPGAVFIDKTAEWVDENNGIAKIVMTINGNPVAKGSDVVLVLDRSGSMADGFVSGTTRLTDMKAAANAFVTELYSQNGNIDSDNRIAMVTFANNASKFPNVSGETFLGVNDNSGGQSAPTFFEDSINAIVADGGTNYDVAFNAAEEIINGRTDTSRPTYVVFMSDGEPNSYWAGIFIGYKYYDGMSTASSLKAAGTTIYSLGLGLTGNSFNNYIEPLASDPKSTYAKEISDNSDLTSIFTGIAGEIKIAGTNAVVTDFVKTQYFDIATKPGDTIWYEATNGTATKNDLTGEVIWNLGNITQAVNSLTIYIKIKDTAPSTGHLDTNEGAYVDYTNYNNESGHQVFPIPALPVGDIGQINMKYYLVDDQGKAITVAGDPIIDFANRVQLASDLFIDPDTLSNQLIIGKLYTVTPPSTIVVGGVIYVYTPLSANNGGSPETQDITLTNSNKSMTFDYGYKKVVDAAYKVEHYQKDVGATTFTLSDTDNLTGVAGEMTNAVAKSYTGFTAGSVTQEAIAADGSTVIRIEYTRNIYTLNYEITGPAIFADPTHATADYEFGATVTALATPSEVGYTFNGWNNEPVIMPAENVNATGYYSIREDIAYTVNYLEQGTNDVLATAKTGTGTFGEDVTENAISISRYRALSPTTVTITLGESGNIITFLYSERVTPPPPPPPPPPPLEEEEEEEVIIDEEIPEAVPELNKEDHIQYIQGYPDNTVRPEAFITREEVAAVFYRLLTEDYRNSIKTTAHKFSDIKLGRWSRRQIATLANGGIIEGYEDGSFRPSEYITRAELATIASRFDNLSPFESNKFSDISGHWANEFINSASEKGWVGGYPDETFKPDQPINRAEFVTLVNNVLDRKVKKEDILLDARQFPDLLETKWYYEAMQEAINSHHYIRKDDGFEEWTEIYYPEPEM